MWFNKKRCHLSGDSCVRSYFDPYLLKLRAYIDRSLVKVQKKKKNSGKCKYISLSNFCFRSLNKLIEENLTTVLKIDNLSASKKSRT